VAGVRARGLSFRSVGLGLLGGGLICLGAPFNDYVLRNSFAVGSALPTAAVMLALVFVVVVNGPLSRWWSRWAFSRTELTIAFAVMLMMCTVPSVGVMRYLPGHLVGFWAHAAQRGEVATLLDDLALPDWLFPTMESKKAAERGGESVVSGLIGAVPAVDDSWLGGIKAVPWGKWAVPAMTWGVFLAALWGGAVALMVLFHDRWRQVERLPFPLATVQGQLLEAPGPGRFLNETLRSPALWIAFGIVFFLHSLNALHPYFSRTVPEVPMSYDLRVLMGTPPLSYVHWSAKAQAISMIVIGVIYFVESRRAFGIWFLYLAWQVALVVMGNVGAEYTAGMMADQQTGAIAAAGLVAVYVGRSHIVDVARLMVSRTDASRPHLRLAGWLLLLCLGVQMVWLTLAGCPWWMSGLVVMSLLLVYFVLARTIAETGLPYVLLPLDFNRSVMYGQELGLKGGQEGVSRAAFFGSWFYGMFTHDTREALPPLASHALRLTDTSDDHTSNRMLSWRAFAFLAIGALSVAYLVGGAGYLWTEYRNAVTLAPINEMPINPAGTWFMPYRFPLVSALDVRSDGTFPVVSHDRLVHFGGGSAFYMVLATLALRFPGWPIAPVGFLLVFTWGIWKIAFSVFLGWLIKLLIVKYGGSRLYTAAKPFFIGLILGEAMAAGLWSAVTMALAAMGRPFFPVNLLPGI
jgi:hypothetical protein